MTNPGAATPPQGDIYMHDTNQAPQAHPHPAQDLVEVRTGHPGAHRAQPQGTGHVRSGDQAAATGDLTAHDVLLGAVESLLEDCRGSEPLMALYSALKAAVELHHPEYFGGVMACLACSPGMPPPLLVPWRECNTSAEVSEALGVELW